MINFLEKYKKYKLKYKKLKNQLGGNINRINADELYNSNPKKAFELYQLAMTQGDINSYYKVAQMYEEGIGVEKDDSRAVQIRKEADKLNFDNFLRTMFTAKELNKIDKLYLLIGTFPYVFKKNEWEAGSSHIMIENSIEYSLILKSIIEVHNRKLKRDK